MFREYRINRLIRKREWAATLVRMQFDSIPPGEGADSIDHWILRRKLNRIDRYTDQLVRLRGEE